MALIEAARLEKKAGAGEIRCTDVLRLLATEEDPGLFVEPEDVPFKGFGEARRVWKIDWRMAPPAPDDLPLPGPVAGRPEDVFVGRAAERARLVRNWEQAQRTGNRLVVVWGEAGIGKSALARTVAQDLHQQRAWVLYGRCDRDQVTPFQPFAEALATFSREHGRFAPAPRSRPRPPPDPPRRRRSGAGLGERWRQRSGHDPLRVVRRGRRLAGDDLARQWRAVRHRRPRSCR